MTNDEYDKVELPALQQLQQLGWTYLHGSQFMPSATGERAYFREVALKKRLSAKVQRINRESATKLCENKHAKISRQ